MQTYKYPDQTLAQHTESWLESERARETEARVCRRALFLLLSLSLSLSHSLCLSRSLTLKLKQESAREAESPLIKRDKRVKEREPPFKPELLLLGKALLHTGKNVAYFMFV